MDDREEPGLDAAAALEIAVRVAPRTKERVLNDILGQGSVSCDAKGD
jgi:hypothetical protein